MPDMLPYIMDAEFNTIGVIDDYISLIWTGRYFNCGDFELQTDITDKARELLQKDNYVWRTDDENIGIIESIRIARDEEEHETLIVSGRFLPGLLARRIIAQNVDYKGKFSDVVNTLINDNAINPAIPARKIPGLKLGVYDIDSRVDRHFDGENLLEKLEEMAEAHNVGFNVTLTDENEFLFMLYEGVDRSYNQSLNPYVVFSGQFDNLKSSDYEENFGGTVTDVLVIGDEINDDGETGTDAQQRYEVWAYKALNAGLSRYETSFSPSSSGNDELTEQEYIDQLKSEGKAQVTQYEAAFTGDVYFNNIQYRHDVFLGDIVTIENSEWGIYINARIIEIIESVDESGLYTVVPTFAVASGVAGDDTTEYIDTETSANILAADNIALMTENSTFDAQHSPYGGAVKISELEPAIAVSDTDCLALAQSGKTSKLDILTLKGIIGGGGGSECPFPVGYVMHMTNGNDPNTLYPGTTWAAINGVFLLASSNDHALGATGGAETVTLTAAQSGLPAHTHAVDNFLSNPQTVARRTVSSGSGATNQLYSSGATSRNSATGAVSGGAKNATSAHENMPPYKVVNVWERTA